MLNTWGADTITLNEQHQRLFAIYQRTINCNVCLTCLKKKKTSKNTVHIWERKYIYHMIFARLYLKHPVCHVYLLKPLVFVSVTHTWYNKLFPNDLNYVLVFRLNTTFINDGRVQLFIHMLNLTSCLRLSNAKLL